MTGICIVAVVLIIAVVLALAFGRFSFTKQSTDAQVGPIELTAKKQEDVNIPMWAGIGAIVVGGVLPVMGKTG